MFEFGGSRYSIRAGRLQILRILLSTYELAIRKNTELVEAQEHLLSLNEQLQQMIEELQVANDDLQMENASRQQAERDLASVNRKLQLMTSITRHDLLNQLTVLQGYMELADENNRIKPDLASAQLKKSLDVIKRSINTVQFTSEYQRIGMTSPSWHPLAACIVNASRYAALGEVRLENEVPAGVEIYADPLIEKAIFNLIDNALRYGLTLTTIRFRIEYQGDTPVIICEDDGIGIRPENKERIFTYGYGTNTGMGLFLVREILGITGIGIRESGEPKKGARFEIRVPPEAYRVT
jgi:signal transduction histidine kinase